MCIRLLPPRERKAFQVGRQASGTEQWERAVREYFERQEQAFGDHRMVGATLRKGCLYYYGTSDLNYLGKVLLLRKKRTFRPGPADRGIEHTTWRNRAKQGEGKRKRYKLARASHAGTQVFGVLQLGQIEKIEASEIFVINCEKPNGNEKRRHETTRTRKRGERTKRK